VGGCHHIGEQGGALTVGLFVVKDLIVGQCSGQRQHMDGRCHVGVNQTNQLEIASHGKNYGIGLVILTCQDEVVLTSVAVLDSKFEVMYIGHDLIIIVMSQD